MPGRHGLGRERDAEEKALDLVAAELAERIPLGLGFDAFDDDPEPQRRLEVAVGGRSFFTGLGSSVVLSPDGRHLVTVVGDGSATELWLRPFDQLEGTRLASGAGTETPYQPFFAPGGDWVGYVTPQDVKTIAPDVLRHRVILTYEAEAEEKSSEDIIEQILANVPVP